MSGDNKSVTKLIGEIGQIIGILFRELEWGIWGIPHSWDAITMSCGLVRNPTLIRLNILEVEKYHDTGDRRFIDKLVIFLIDLLELSTSIISHPHNKEPSTTKEYVELCS